MRATVVTAVHCTHKQPPNQNSPFRSAGRPHEHWLPHPQWNPRDRHWFGCYLVLCALCKYTETEFKLVTSPDAGGEKEKDWKSWDESKKGYGEVEEPEKEQFWTFNWCEKEKERKWTGRNMGRKGERKGCLSLRIPKSLGPAPKNYTELHCEP